MQKLTDNLTAISLAGKVPLDRALRLAAPIDEEREEVLSLLLKLEKQVGQHLGEEILRMIARIKGTRFNEIEYHYEKEPDEQKR